MRGSMFFLMCKCLIRIFCLSASVNVRYDLRTHSELYIKILVWYLLIYCHLSTITSSLAYLNQTIFIRWPGPATTMTVRTMMLETHLHRL
jgi:hypothetical protein